MAFRKLFGLLLSAVIAGNSYADEIQINPNHPEQYTVVEGDTLWHISGKFLEHPSQWPELWSYNHQIRNPHLIYPGDSIYFSMVNGKPQLSLTRNSEFPGDGATTGQLNIQSPCVLHEDEFKNGRTKFPTTPDGKLMPCIREINLKQAIRLIPNEKISQFLSNPRVVGATELNNAAYVLEMAGEHLTTSLGDRVYVRGPLLPNVRSYTIYRPGETYKNPETGEILGYEARYIADASLAREGDPATFKITRGKIEILMGDRVMPNLEENVTLTYFPKPPAKKITGNIISVNDGVSQIGQYNTVVIDKGSKDGLQIGHELDIFQKGRSVIDPYSAVKNDTVKLPDEKAGMLMVFRTFDRVSYALVMKATQAIHVFDKVKTP